MTRKLALIPFAVFLSLGLVLPTFALEKLKLGASVKVYPAHYLPALTAEDKGFWKENGLDVEWVPVGSDAAEMRAVAAGALNIGMATSAGIITAAGGGLPVVMVNELVSSVSWKLWVRADSPYRNVLDLKNKRIGVTALGGITHAFGRIVAKAHGIENDLRFVGAGGARQNVAGLWAGSFDASILGMASAARLKVEGKIREISSARDYLPKPWFDDAIFARKNFAQTKPDEVRRVIKATLQATDFIQRNPRWTIDKMVSFTGIPEEAAKLLYDDTKFTANGHLDRKAVENIRDVLIRYGIINEKAPAADDLFTNAYLP